LTEEIEVAAADVSWSDIAVVVPDVVADVPDYLAPADQTDSSDLFDTMEVEAEQIGSIPGSPGYPCITAADCLSDFCIQTNDGKQCTAPCEEECPFDWSCVVYSPLLPDQVLICVPADVEICKPCMVNADCFSDEIDAGQVCVDFGDVGRFCGTSCGAAEECPEGFGCVTVMDATGAKSQQCVREDGECECSKAFTDAGAETLCSVENEFGVCVGSRKCLAEGLTNCDAAVPVAESCNGEDDDCDGEVDEESGGTECPIVSSDGTCPGVLVCTNGELFCDGEEAVPEICDGLDNDCSGEVDEGYPDTDGDGTADCLETDKDGDGIEDVEDNCPADPNPGQENADFDVQGDVCDQDDDNDLTPDEIDCAPFDAAVHPGAEEVCDGQDNDCNSAADEDLGQSTCGLGECEHTVPNCLDGEVQVCDPLTGVAEEICDGLDNNCDGETDEELGDTTCGLGECEHTVPNCVDGEVQICDPMEGEVEETCDGLDNNCDGNIDEDLGQLACGLGECFHVIDMCVGGELQICDPMGGEADELCDGLDNNCDGDVDEDLGQIACGLGECAHVVDACSGGQPQICDPLAGQGEEVCDSLDNDCNGEVDDELGQLACGLGECFHVIDTCLEGEVQVCDPLEGKEAEICDSLDNDCNGEIDDELGQLACGLGECFHVIDTCVDGEVLVCDPLEGSADEVCDGKDNNCDGEMDEELGETTCGLGECEHSQANCVDGEPQECDPLAGSVDETCDGKDNNCDGAIDEGCGGPSCQALYVANPALPSGVYDLDPEGDGSSFKAYCDMKTEGGGWTLVWKQSNHESAHFVHTPNLAGNSVLLSEAYDGTTQGSIRSWFEGGDLLFKSSDSMWVKLTDTLDNWALHSGNSPGRCRKLTSVPSSCAGLDCGVYRHAFITLPDIIVQMSGFMIGPKHSGYPSEECSEVWCSNSKHGRYDGSCSSGPKGVGNWMLFVR